MLKLVIQDDEGKTTVVPLVHDEITIGRQEGNTIRLTERNVSRQHARVRRVNGPVTIEDLDSYNGVRVNGNVIDREATLEESDRVQIGDYLLELREEAVEHADSEQSTQRLAREAAVGAEAADGDEGDEADKTIPIPALEPEGDAAAAPAAAVEESGDDAAEALRREAEPAAPAEAAVPAGAERDPPVTKPLQAQSARELGKDEHGKLVVLSTNFAARELTLDKPSVVIGRTTENDICLDHRSISRHHAKVIREDGRYAIVDLQSSNGVRVNGEEYGKVELRRGDVVDLGHVRMRYVEPGEDFVLGRDAQPVDLETGRRRGVLWAMVAVLVVGGGAGLFAIGGGGEDVADEGTTQEGAAETEPGEREPGEREQDEHAARGDGEEDELDLPERDDPPEDLEEEEVDELRARLDAASEAVADDRWDEALAEAEGALEIDPEDEQASALAAQAEDELENRERYEAFLDAVEAADYASVAATFEDIGRESVYRVRAQDEHDRMRDEYVDTVERRARRAADRGACGRVERIAREARGVWPEAGRAASVSCDPAVASGGDDRTSSAEQDDPTSGDGGDRGDASGRDDAGTDQPEQTVAEVVADAQAAARNGEFGRALRLCEDALSRSRGHSEALMVCLISACNLRNVSRAERYMSQISGDQRIHARQVCLRHGVDVE